jgi:hypothetical protein
MGDRPILVIGQRIDFDPHYDDFRTLLLGASFLPRVDAMVQNSPHSMHRPTGVDMFLFRISHFPFEPERIPPFLMGRPWWDSWLVGYLNHLCDTITFSLNPPIYHIDHKSQWGTRQITRSRQIITYGELTGIIWARTLTQRGESRAKG